MQIEPGRTISHAAAVKISEALREVFGHATQADIAARLTAGGMPTDQTKVSAWLRGRVPNIEQMNAIETCYGVPHGIILTLAGFIDIPSCWTYIDGTNTDMPAELLHERFPAAAPPAAVPLRRAARGDGAPAGKEPMRWTTGPQPEPQDG